MLHATLSMGTMPEIISFIIMILFGYASEGRTLFFNAKNESDGE